MADHDNPVGREADVQLQAVGAGGQSTIEGGNGVFRTQCAAAAMREHAGAAAAKERHNAQCSMLDAQ